MSKFKYAGTLYPFGTIMSSPQLSNELAYIWAATIYYQNQISQIYKPIYKSNYTEIYTSLYFTIFMLFSRLNRTDMLLSVF